MGEVLILPLLKQPTTSKTFIRLFYDVHGSIMSKLYNRGDVRVVNRYFYELLIEY